MKAVLYEKYGPPEAMKLREIEKPTPKDDEILVKIHATSVNASDHELLTGNPPYARIWGLFKPNYKVLGSDIAGTVEAIGKNVTEFNPGDEVFGDLFEHWGGFAEYVSAPEKMWISKPKSLSFESIAALPQAAVIALQGLRDKGKIQKGQHVLINGAGGGAGSFAIQLAKMYNAEVTAVDHTEKLELMRSIGADHVVDYTKEDYTKSGKQYDLVLDFVAKRSIFDSKKALKPEGRYVIVGGYLSIIFQTVFIGPLISIFEKKKMSMLAAKQSKEDLKFIIELIESGKIKAIIDKKFSLEEVPEALRYLGDGHAKGKVVVKM